MDGLDNLGGSELDRDESRGPLDYPDTAPSSSSASSSQYAPVVDIYTVPSPSLKAQTERTSPALPLATGSETNNNNNDGGNINNTSATAAATSSIDTSTQHPALSAVHSDSSRHITPTPVARHPPIITSQPVPQRSKDDNADEEDEEDSIDVGSDDDDDEDEDDDDEDDDEAYDDDEDLQSYHDDDDGEGDANDDEGDDDDEEGDMTATKSYADGWQIGGGGTTTTKTNRATAAPSNPLHRRRRGARASTSATASSSSSAGDASRRKKSRPSTHVQQQQQQHMRQTRIVVNNPDSQHANAHALGYIPDASGLAAQQNYVVDPHADDDFIDSAAPSSSPATEDAQREHGMRTLHPPTEEDGGRWIPCPLPSEVSTVQQELSDARYAEMKRAAAPPGFSGCEMCDIGDAACTKFTSQVLTEILNMTDNYDTKMHTDAVYALMVDEYNRHIHAEAKRLNVATVVQEWTVPMVRYHMENHDKTNLRRRIQKQVDFWENLQKETRRYAGVMERYVVQGHATAHTRINADAYALLKDQTTMLLKLYDTQHKLSETEFRREVAIARQESIAEAAGKKTTIGRLGKLAKVRQARTSYFKQKRLRQESTANMTASSLAIYSKESMAVKGKGSLAATNGVIKIEDLDAIEGGAENQSILVDRHAERTGKQTGSARLRKVILY